MICAKDRCMKLYPIIIIIVILFYKIMFSLFAMGLMVLMMQLIIHDLALAL